MKWGPLQAERRAQTTGVCPPPGVSSTAALSQRLTARANDPLMTERGHRRALFPRRRDVDWRCGIGAGGPTGQRLSPIPPLPARGYRSARAQPSPYLRGVNKRKIHSAVLFPSKAAGASPLAVEQPAICHQGGNTSFIILVFPFLQQGDIYSHGIVWGSLCSTKPSVCCTQGAPRPPRACWGRGEAVPRGGALGGGAAVVHCSWEVGTPICCPAARTRARGVHPRDHPAAKREGTGRWEETQIEWVLLKYIIY